MKFKRLKNLSIWMLALALLAILPGTALVAQGGRLVTTTQTANIRSGPGTEFEIIVTVRAGTTILLDGRTTSGNWVRGITSGGTVGWLSSGLVGLSLSDLTAMPIVNVNTPFSLSAPSAGSGAAPSGADSSAPSAQTVSPGSVRGGQQATVTNNVNMRAGPGTEFRRVGGAGFNTTLSIDGRNSARTWVRGANDAGVVGWVSVSFIDISAQDLNRLPVVDPSSPFGLATGSTEAPAQEQAADPAPSEPLPPITNTAPVTGFAYGGHVQSFGGNTISAMQRAGMTWVKKQVRAGSGAGEISAAHGAGFRIVLGVIGDKSRVSDPAYLDSYAAQLAGLAAAGADAIEVWNEPNIEREWQAGAISPVLYTDMLRRAYTAIKQANPNTLVISGAPAPTGFFGGCSGAGCDDNLFVQGMAAAGAANYMDCIGIHYNEGIVPPSATSGDPRGNSGHYTRYLQTMTNTYYNAFGGRRPVCYTELGYLTPEGFGPLPSAFAWAANTTVAQQAAWLKGAVDISRNSGRVRLVIIWNVDFTNYGEDPMAGYAMIRPDGRCPACDVLGGG